MKTLDRVCKLPAHSHIFTAEQVCMLKPLWGKCLLVPTDKPNLLSPSNTDFWNVPNRKNRADTGTGAFAGDRFHFPRRTVDTQVFLNLKSNKIST